jgi:predicted DNA binding CopG/RHH family protein
MKVKKDKFIIARVTEETFEKFKRKSIKNGMKVSDKIRELVEGYIK